MGNFFSKLLKQLNKLAQSLGDNWYILTIVGLVSLSVLGSDQGRDLLAALKTNIYAYGFTCFFLLLLALLLWNVMRRTQGETLSSSVELFHFQGDHPADENPATPKDDWLYYILPRLIPSFLFIAFYAGTLQLYYENIPGYPRDGYPLDTFVFNRGILLMFIIFLVYIWWMLALDKNIGKFPWLGVVGIGIAAFMPVIVMAIRGPITGDRTLFWMAYGYLYLGMLYLWMVVRRRQRSGTVFKRFLVRLNDVIWLAFAGVSVYVLILLFQPSVHHHFPLFVIMAILIVYTVIFGTIHILTRKTPGFQRLLLISLVGAPLVIPTWINRHELTFMDPAIVDTSYERSELEDHFSDWLDARQVSLDTSGVKKYPVYLIAGQGGGSRAAYWSALILGQLDSLSQGGFSDHIYAMTSASGSSSGFGTYLQMMANEVPDKKRKSMVKRMFSTNFLSTALRDLLTFDWWSSYVSISRKGRNTKLEREWSNTLQDAMRKEGITVKYTMDSSFLSIWKNQPGLPVFIPNTTEVKRGRRAFMSPVIMEKDPNGLDLLDSIGIANSNALRFSSAMVLSASFPVITASYCIPYAGQYADGGYFDNHGANTMNTLIQSCQHFLEDTGKDRFFEIRVLHIKNGSSDKREIKKRLTDRGPTGQLAIPLSTIIALQSGVSQTFSESIQIDSTWYRVIALDHEIVLPLDTLSQPDTRKFVPLIPTARYLSQEAMQGIEANLVLQQGVIEEILGEME